MQRFLTPTCRTVAMLLLVLSAWEFINGEDTDGGLRIVVICVVAAVFNIIALYQVWLTLRKEGLPRSRRVSFRWVMNVFLASIALFMNWVLLAQTLPVFSEGTSIVMWLILGEAALWFLSRWAALDEPRAAEPGETVASA